MSKSPRRGSLLVIFLTVFIDLLGFGIVLPLLPIYADEFTLDESGIQLGLLMASFSAMQFIFAPIWGRLSDRIGRRPVILIGLFGSVVFYALFGYGTVRSSMMLLFISRIGAGVSGATISTAQAYIADSTSLEKRASRHGAHRNGIWTGVYLRSIAWLPRGAHWDGGSRPLPGFVAAGLSFFAFVVAIFALPESLHTESETASHTFFDVEAWRMALSIPSVGVILVSIFVCVFSFANFETTLAMLIKGNTDPAAFKLSFRQVCLTFAYIGFVLALVQGGLVRRLAGKVSEGAMAATGAAAEVIGFACLIVAIYQSSTTMLYVALTIVVGGFAFITPSLNSLLSRRSDPKRQGAILGIGQSTSSLARIVGAGLGIPLLKLDPVAPFISAALLMAGGLLLDRLGLQNGTRLFSLDWPIRIRRHPEWPITSRSPTSTENRARQGSCSVDPSARMRELRPAFRSRHPRDHRVCIARVAGRELRPAAAS